MPGEPMAAQPSIPLEVLTARLPQARALNGSNTQIHGITHDSRRVRPGDLFVCLVGAAHDRHRFGAQALLARMREGGADAVVMEVSSHALEQHRTDGIAFSAGVFTNLTQDHLDYHESMEASFAAKARLFADYPVRYPRADGTEFVAAI